MFARPRIREVLVVGVVLVLQVGGTYAASRHRQDGRTAFDPVALALLVAGPIALIWRRRAPEAVFAVTFATTFAYAVRGYPHGPIWLAMIVALHSLVVAGRRIFALGALAVGFVSFVWLTHLLGREPAPSVASTLGIGAWLIVLYGALEAWRIRGERAAEEARMREEAARRQVSEERLRIAREVHDVVAHNISMINVQAGVALHLMHDHPDRPEHAERALAAIKASSRETLSELRSVLGILRAVDEGAPRSPAPGLARLDELAEHARAAGLDVAVAVEGPRRELPGAVDLAAYRIVQEALTNVARHAGGSHARVRLVYGGDDLIIEVEDDGRGFVAARNGHGSGIVGMQERAGALGGNLNIDQSPSGGARVRARIPLTDAS